MYFYELFSHSDRFFYRAHLISSATCVLILCTSLTFLPPFLLTYYTGDFWTKESVYSEQPRISDSVKYILITGNDGLNNNGFLMSSYLALNSNFQQRLIYGTDSVLASDIDGDGIIDQFYISFDLLSLSASTIQNINIWLIFQYELREKQRITMETMALISIIPPSQFTTNSDTNLTVYGQLIFEQKTAIQNAGNDSTYNKSIINAESLPSSFDLNSILNEYFIRKYYTSYKTQYTWMTPRTSTSSSSSSSSGILTINVVVNVGRQAIRYIPGFWQEFKWGWIQYICVLLPFMIVFNRLKLFVFSNQLVRTLVPLPNYRNKA